MKSGRRIASLRLPLWKTALVLLLVTSAGVSAPQRKEDTAKTLIWDTLSPFVNTVDFRDRNSWKPVPTDLLRLELDPLAAFSDPGYYGREYSFKGDVVVENEHLTTVFSSKKGCVVIYSRADSSQKKVELIPLQLKGKPASPAPRTPRPLPQGRGTPVFRTRPAPPRGGASITSCRILQNTGDQAALEVTFSAKETEDNYSAIFSFDKKQIVEIKPAENMKGISLLSPIEYGVVPSFIGDDLIFNPREYPSMTTLHIPSDNLLLGLLKGENNVLVVTWPEGKQQVKLVLGELREPRLIESVDLKHDGKSIYLALLSAPGIWHKEQLLPSYLERDVAINWKRPFSAKWVTQLYEDGVKTTFRFRESKIGRFWRGGVGSYTYPVWFQGEKAFYRLGKKIPPKGESLVYFVEASKNTPDSVSTPTDIVKQTLGNQTYESMLDFEGRKLKSDSRANSVVGTATCGVTDKLKRIFEAGKETEKKEYIKGGTEDMLYHLTVLSERVDEYQDFAHEMIEFLTLMKKDKPELKPFLDKMENVTKELITAYHLQKENTKTLEYAEGLAKKTVALTRKNNSDNLSTFLKLGQEWRGMGGSLEGLNRKLHTTARKLLQEAGCGFAGQHATIEIAEEIRSRTKKLLRNPNGYEIWSNY